MMTNIKLFSIRLLFFISLFFGTAFLATNASAATEQVTQLPLKIGIMGAMNEEVDLLVKDMQNKTVRTIADRKYYSGKLYGMDTTIVFSRWGKVASASTATTLIDTFKVNRMIFTGVAGAVSPELNIGDIIIADTLYQHDMDVRPLFGKLEIPLLARTYFDVDKKQLNFAQLAARKFLSQDITQEISADALKNFSIMRPKMVTGTIASGDQFVSDPKKLNELLADNANTKAVEMEGAAVAQVCYEHKMPFIIARVISDKADHSAAVDFQKFIAGISSHYSRGFIRNVFQLYQKDKVNIVAYNTHSHT